jgi:LysM repeat protein
MVVRGDTLTGISRRYSVGVSDIMRANNLNNDLIREGQKLTIP